MRIDIRLRRCAQQFDAACAVDDLRVRSFRGRWRRVNRFEKSDVSRLPQDSWKRKRARSMSAHHHSKLPLSIQRLCWRTPLLFLFATTSLPVYAADKLQWRVLHARVCVRRTAIGSKNIKEMNPARLSCTRAISNGKCSLVAHRSGTQGQRVQSIAQMTFNRAKKSMRRTSLLVGRSISRHSACFLRALAVP